MEKLNVPFLMSLEKETAESLTIMPVDERLLQAADAEGTACFNVEKLRK